MAVVWSVALTTNKLKLSQKSVIYFLITGLAAKYALLLVYRKFCRRKKSQASSATSPAFSVASAPKQPTDANFIDQLRSLLKIVIPRVFCKESLILGVHSVILVCRTFLSIYVATLDGCIAKSIVQKDVPKFAFNLLKFILVALPATFINSMIKYLEKKLGLAFRERLVRYVYGLYCKNQTFYRVTNLDSRLNHVDQCMTDDLAVFAESFGVVATTAWLLKAWTPKFGQLIAEEARRKGKLRHAHGRIITNAEEIAFFNGEKVEHRNLLDAFLRLTEQTEVINKKRVLFVTIEQFLMKYVWSATGMLIVAVPTLTATFIEDEQEFDRGVGARTKGFETAKNLLTSAASAVERLISSYKEIAELSGYTKRVWQMIEVFKDVAEGNYCKNTAPFEQNGTENLVRRYDVTKIRGVVEENHDFIQLVNVPIVTPSGDVVSDQVNLKVTSGMHLLISGPNGCGKSSLFRILDGLWPCYDGIVKRPAKHQMFYIPQRPYMCVGTLRDQVIYPDSHEFMKLKGVTDADLNEVLKIVHLNYVVGREGGWNSVNEWSDVLSGGEKQRLALARIFYHRPKFALLDECTSAVSMDVEAEIYKSAQNHKISLLTVTHRPSLWKYHTHILRFDGEGNCSFTVL